jgi:hypothetical protein
LKTEVLQRKSSGKQVQSGRRFGFALAQVVGIEFGSERMVLRCCHARRDWISGGDDVAMTDMRLHAVLKLS